MARLVRSDLGDWNDPSTSQNASFTQGNMLVAIGSERTGGDSANYVISGTGWVEQSAGTILPADLNFRRSWAVYTKIAGASEPTEVTLDDGTGNSKRLTVFEIELEPGENQFTLLDVVEFDNAGTLDAASLNLGTTISLPSAPKALIGISIIKTGVYADNPDVNWTEGFATAHNDVSGWQDVHGMQHIVALKNDVTAGAKTTTFSYDITKIGNYGLAGVLLAFRTGADVVDPLSATPDNNTPSEGSTVSVTVTNGTGPYALQMNGATYPIDSQNSGNITLTASGLKEFSDANNVPFYYNQPNTFTITDTDDGDTTTFTLSPTPAASHFFDTITELNGIWLDPAYTAIGIAIGDRAHIVRTAGTGDVDIPTGALGHASTYSITIQDQNDGVWGSSGIVTIPTQGAQVGFSIDLAWNAAINAISTYFPNGDAYSNVVEIQTAYGQSNNFGWKTRDRFPDNPVNQDNATIRMLNGTYDGLIAASEMLTNPISSNALNQSGLVAFANYRRAFELQRGISDVSQVLMVNGFGSTQIANLSKGSSYYTTWMNHLTAAVSAIQGEGKTAKVLHIPYCQGEADVNNQTEANYAERLRDLYDDMNADVKAITGQTEDIIMYLTVLTMHNNYTGNGQEHNEIALEQLRAATLRPNLIIPAVHSGWVDHDDDGIHWSGQGQRYDLQMIAKFCCFKDLRALTAESAVLNGSTIELQLAGGFGDLQFNYDTVTDPGAHKNFRVLNSDATPAEVTITSVNLDNVNRKVNVTLADGGTNGPYEIQGCYYSTASTGGGQYHQRRIPITDSDNRIGTVNDSTNIGNDPLENPLMPFRITGVA